MIIITFRRHKQLLVNSQKAYPSTTLLRYARDLVVVRLIAGTHLDRAVPVASVGSRCPIPEAGKEQAGH